MLFAHLNITEQAIDLYLEYDAIPTSKFSLKALDDSISDS